MLVCVQHHCRSKHLFQQENSLGRSYTLLSQDHLVLVGFMVMIMFLCQITCVFYVVVFPLDKPKFKI